MTHKSIVIYWNGQRAIQNRRELISVKQLRLRLWNKKYFFRMLRYGQFGIRRLSQSQVLSAKKLQYLIDNQWKDSAATEWIEVRNPATQEVVSLVPVQPLSEMEAVAESSQKAFQSWKNTSILSRQQIMLKYQELIKEHKTEIAKLITLEQGYDVILT